VNQVATDLAKTGVSGRWGYQKASSSQFDHSNTQYAVLGLKAARLCGWKRAPSVDSGVWRAVLTHFLIAQQIKGTNVQLRVRTERSGSGGIDYSAPGWEKSPGEEHDYVASAQARGWSYRNRGDSASFNMTIAGLTAVIVARSELGGLPEQQQEQADRAVGDGMAWSKRIG
jgi:hypothetical protein